MKARRPLSIGRMGALVLVLAVCFSVQTFAQQSATIGHKPASHVHLRSGGPSASPAIAASSDQSAAPDASQTIGLRSPGNNDPVKAPSSRIGLYGLLGLIGLFGFGGRRRRESHTRNERRSSSRMMRKLDHSA